MSRLRTAVLLPFLPVLIVACGSNDELAGELSAQRAEAEAARAELDEAQAAHALQRAVLADVAALVLDETAALAARDTAVPDPNDLRERAERILRATSERRSELLASGEGLRLFVDARGRAAAWLADPGIGLAERAREIGAESLAVAEAALAEDPSNRRLTAAVGDGHVNLGRIAWAAGDDAGAVAAYRIGVDTLRQADKGRGTGTGSSEFRGDGSGGGGGRGRGKGKNREQSVALKRHTIRVHDEIAAIHRAAGRGQDEHNSLTEARLLAGQLCQALSNGPDDAYQVARLRFAELIDRIADAAGRAKGNEQRLRDEQLSLMILREIYAEAPGKLVFFERVVPQEIEIAELLVELGRLEDLRALVTQALEDLKVLVNLDYPAPSRAGLEAQLSLQMARGLVATGDPAHRAEAANWYGRAIELLDAARVGGVLPAALVPVEEAALIGIDELQG